MHYCLTIYIYFIKYNLKCKYNIQYFEYFSFLYYLLSVRNNKLFNLYST